MKPDSVVLYLTQNYYFWKLNLNLKQSACILEIFPLGQYQVLKHECFLVLSLFPIKTVH